MSMKLAGTQAGLTLAGITASDVIIRAVLAADWDTTVTGGAPNAYLHDGRYGGGAGLSYTTFVPAETLRSDNSTIYLNSSEITLVSELFAAVSGDVLDVLIDSHTGDLTLFCNQSLGNIATISLSSLQILNAAGDTVLNNFDLDNINTSTNVIPDTVGSGVLTARSGGYTVTPTLAPDLTSTDTDNIIQVGQGTFTMLVENLSAGANTFSATIGGEAATYSSKSGDTFTFTQTAGIDGLTVNDPEDDPDVDGYATTFTYLEA